MQKTPLYECHKKAGGKIVDFAGWQLPVHYGSLVDEHMAVRQSAGVFDVSHMTIVDVAGTQAKPFLRKLLANDVATLQTSGSALYSCMLNEQGGIIDDLIVYFFDDENYRVVVNAATRDKDIAWFQSQAREFDVTITEHPQLAMLAVQGPQAVEKVAALLEQPLADQCKGLSRYQAVSHGDWFVAATGYTGENGFELAMPAADASDFWTDLLAAGVIPCGLGARDTLRLEAGMNLYGTDMTEKDTPLSSGLAWTVAFDPQAREFNGRAALEAEMAGGQAQQMIGLVLDGKGVLRGGQLLYKDDNEIGVVTSGTFSPSLKKSIAFARVNADHHGDCEVQIRRNRLPVTQVKRVFVRNGKPVV